ncbi:TraV family lipoprotein [Shewanella baltica]|uniref:TraV family lipoprotein n=1 Tax=Shewanella baltica TaxID=62322 RepID=UPI0039B0C844
MITRAVKLGMVAVGMVTLVGCQSMFETGEEPTVCANTKNSGLPCTTTRDILKFADTPGGIEAEKARRAAVSDEDCPDCNVSKSTVAPGGAAVNQSGYGVDVNGNPISLNDVSNAYMFNADNNRILPAPEPIAVRQAPRMLRVAFAPWQDDKGRLQNVGYVYTEIETRKYTYGREAFNMPAQITPLYIRQQSIEEERKGNPSEINGVGIKTDKAGRKNFNADLEAAKATFDQAPQAVQEALRANSN